jgi:hypothetical protein
VKRVGREGLVFVDYDFALGANDERYSLCSKSLSLMSDKISVLWFRVNAT